MGASPNRQDVDGNSALHHAAATCRLESSRALIQRGANASLENSQKEYPMEVIAKGVGSNIMNHHTRTRARMISALVRPKRTLHGVEKLFGSWATPEGRKSTRNIVFFIPLIWLGVAGCVRATPKPTPNTRPLLLRIAVT
jgi:ankyrin repeat protein